MLDIHFIKENKDIVQKSLQDRGRDDVDLDAVIEKYNVLIETRKTLDDIHRKQKEAADARNIEEGKQLKAQAKEIQDKEKEQADSFRILLSQIPNVPTPDTPLGKDESENVVLRTIGELPSFSFKPREHDEIGRMLDIIDSERAVKVSGSRFVYLKGGAALLQMALMQFVFSSLTNEEVIKKIVSGMETSVSTKPFVPIFPPTLIKPDIFLAAARLEPKEERFYVSSDDLYLVGSAEHTLCTMFAGETLQAEKAPYRFIGYSTAYRREAGSYGKDTRGIIRLHQFDKLEMESFTSPENSRLEHEFFIAVQEWLTQQLQIPYRVLAICTGDMSDPNQKQTDIEMWMPGQGVYRETHTADFMGSYQARRLGTKITSTDGKKDVAHTNDATAFAIGRTLVAILENYQQEDGSVKVPKVLQDIVGLEYISP